MSFYTRQKSAFLPTVATDDPTPAIERQRRDHLRFVAGPRPYDRHDPLANALMRFSRRTAKRMWCPMA